MAGNVWEWCLTKYRVDYTSEKEDNSLEGGEPRSLRGGAFYYGARKVRCANRFRRNPDYRDWYIGFRVVLAPGFSSVL